MGRGCASHMNPYSTPISLFEPQMMDLETLDQLDLDTWASLVNDPSRTFEDPDTTSNLSFHNLDLLSPTHQRPPWQEQAVNEWSSIGSTPGLNPVPPDKVASLTAATGVLNGLQAPQLGGQPRSKSSLPPSPRGAEKCSCLRNLLQISEQLDHHSAIGPSFTNTLALFQKGLRVCERYAQCRECDESLTEILCVSALRRASVCYKQVAVATQGPTFAAAGERKVRCRFGQFESDVVLDVEILKELLRSELERASSIATELEKLLGHGTGKRRPVDPVTRRYHQDLVKNVHNDIQATLHSLKQA